MDHPKCATCDHYEPETDDYPPYILGYCKKVEHGADACEWSEDGYKVLKKEHRDALAFVNDASGYSASLSPAPNFYCAHHSALT